jgi:thymidylate kinase
MLNIIEGANFVGKTSTMDELKKKNPSSVFVYHPRFNDAQHYYYEYKIKKTIRTMEIPRDIVYQISHVVCLKYLKSFSDKNIIMDRAFISEMVYNDNYEEKLYAELVDILQKEFEYKIYFLTCDDDEQLKLRIKARLEQDKTKNGFGVRVEDYVDPETVEEKFNIQKILTQRYINIFEFYRLNYKIIDTSHVVQKEVAKLIIKDMKGENE